ncbi:type I-U CRISPR-associated protein Csb2 [Micromonospora sp. NPDC050417]|uniref:type I-G CRISPR-associated protein Csb2 n=1 Tax=Micromonospora sp. NPDC050417 TaxID=3364280 RepID=UPI00379EC8FD
MALSITVRLRDGRYDAADLAAQMEWPPHPARLFCALLASAENEVDAPGYDADDAALRWLEQAGPPLVLAVPTHQVATSVRSGFVVTNVTKRSAGSTRWPGRTNGQSSRSGGLPTDDQVAFVWPDANADDGVLWRLSRLARRVPYFGRSTSSAEVDVRDEVIESRPSWVTYQPTRLGDPDALALRVPYPGYTDQLRAAYAQGERAWQMSRAVDYVLDDGGLAASGRAASRVADGPYQEMLVWPAEQGRVPIQGDRLLTVTDILRRAVLDRVADPVPPQVSGHGADGSAHVGYLPLLDVGHQHADGHLLGVAVALPGDLPEEDRIAVLRGLLGEEGEDPIRVLRAGTEGVFRLGDPAEPPKTWGLRPDRWMGQPAGARRWVSVTPMMLDRYPGRKDPAEVLADGFVTAGYPRPESVTVLEAPLVRGAVRLPRRGTVPEGRPRRPFVHCRVEFPTRVRGPVIAGALRYLGCGLFVPEVPDARH